MSNRSKYIVETHNLAIGYKIKKELLTIARGINIKQQPQQLVALLGKNGIGKSTLLRTLTKVQPELSGKITLNGKNLQEVSAKVLSQKVSLVLTERIPESNLTVYELIALGRQPYTNWIGTLTEEDKNFIATAIDSTNTKDFIHKKHHELSDGQLQKVMIARALAQNTEIIILDEPTAHLDIHHKIEVFNLLQTLVKKFKKTIIVSTHEIQLALQLADELWLMNETGFISGDTQNLIASNKLTNLFDSELIEFDTNSKQFIIKS